MSQLKKNGKPFTSVDELDSFISQDLPEVEKKKRMKAKIQFARDSSTTLPKCDPIFRIRVTLANKKQRDKTSMEYAEAMKALLGKGVDISKQGLSLDTSSNKSLKNVLSQG